MIRTTTELSAEELETVLSIWLHANLDSHGFISPTYWESQIESVRKAFARGSDLLSRNRSRNRRFCWGD